MAKKSGPRGNQAHKKPRSKTKSVRHNKPEMTWDVPKVMFDNIVDLINVNQGMRFYLEDPNVNRYVNEKEAIETMLLISSDVLKVFEPRLSELREVLAARSGKVKDDEIADFTDIFNAMTVISDLATGPFNTSTSSMWVQLTRAVNAHKQAAGLSSYVPPAAQEFANREQQRILLEKETAGHA